MLNLIEEKYTPDNVKKQHAKMKNQKKNSKRRNRKQTEEEIEENERIINDEKSKIRLVIGDWSIGKQMKGITSTPNIRMRRLLQERFWTCDFDETGTSKYNCKTDEENKNLYLLDNNKNKSRRQMRKIHAILSFKTKTNGRWACINRNKNAVINFKRITDHFLKTKERLNPFIRTPPQKTATISAPMKGTEVVKCR